MCFCPQAANKSERLSTAVTARVLVRDVNDNAPTIVAPAPGTVLSVNEAAPTGTVLCHVVAVDRDSGDNGRVSYSMMGDADGRFSVNRDTGAVTLMRPPVENGGVARRSFTLNVTATDHGVASKTVHRTLQVTVTGATQSPPSFLQPAYHVNVSEDAALTAFVLKVSARSTLPEPGKPFSWE